MNELKIFENPKFGNIRTITEDSKTLFCGKDVAAALGYKRPNEAISAHCKGTVKRRTLTDRGMQEMLFIPEGDIYRLTAKSELPGADEFESWIFDEVLPSIRRHGAYMTPDTLDKMIASPEFGIKLLTALQHEREARKRLEKEKEESKQKVLFADAVSVSQTSILIGELAKILHQNGVETGQNRLFSWMRNNGYLIRRQGTDYNMPTQRAMEMGLFRIKETVITHADGHTSVNKTVKVTGRGQQHFVNVFLGQQNTECTNRR